MDVPAGILCPPPATGGDRQIFFINQMNKALTRNPTAAAQLGFTAARTCRQARALAVIEAGASETARAKPIEGITIVGVAQNEDEDIESMSASLNGGQPDTTSDFPLLNPVVQIAPAKLNSTGTQVVSLGGQCTGTFIAKNWILTAGHCLKDMNPGETSRDSNWAVIWQWPAGTPMTERIKYYAHVFIGGTFARYPLYGGPPDYANDVALVYLSRSNQADRYLPPMPSSSAYLSDYVAVSDPKTDFYMAGWAETNDYREAPLPAGIPRSLDDKVIQASVTAPWAMVLPCAGDSGGPFFWKKNNNNKDRPVVVGVLSHAGDTEPVWCARIGSTIVWNRVDTPVIRDWINLEMARAEGTLKISSSGKPTPTRTICNSANPENGESKPPPYWFRCWGQPCGAKLPKCTGGKSEVCRGAGSDFQRKTCGPRICPNGSCDCIVGECVPKSAIPSPDAGARG